MECSDGENSLSNFRAIRSHMLYRSSSHRSRNTGKIFDAVYFFSYCLCDKIVPYFSSRDDRFNLLAAIMPGNSSKFHLNHQSRKSAVPYHDIGASAEKKHWHALTPRKNKRLCDVSSNMSPYKIARLSPETKRSKFRQRDVFLDNHSSCAKRRGAGASSKK